MAIDKSSNTHVKPALSASARERLEAYLHLVDDAIKNGCRTRGVQVDRAFVLHRLGRDGEALKCLQPEVLAEFVEESFECEEIVVAYRRSEIELSLNLLQPCVEDASKVISEDSTVIQAYEIRARAYDQMGKSELADKDRRKRCEIILAKEQKYKQDLARTAAEAGTGITHGTVGWDNSNIDNALYSYKLFEPHIKQK